MDRIHSGSDQISIPFLNPRCKQNTMVRVLDTNYPNYLKKTKLPENNPNYPKPEPKNPELELLGKPQNYPFGFWISKFFRYFQGFRFYQVPILISDFIRSEPKKKNGLESVRFLLTI